MKKMSIFFCCGVALYLIYLLNSCGKDSNYSTNPSVSKLINSKQFSDFSKSTDAIVDLSKIKFEYFWKDSTLPLIRVPFFKDGRLIGILEAIENKSNRYLIPNNGKYFMMYRNLSKFDFNNLTGEVSLVDMNYDAHIFDNVKYSKENYESHKFNGVSQKILNKYAALISSNKNAALSYNRKQLLKGSESGIQNKSIEKMNPNLMSLGDPDKDPRSKLCDNNRDGDISYSECYHCFNSTCQNNTDCYFLCYGIGDVVGWVLSPVKIP